MSVKQLHQFHRQKEEKFQQFELQEIDKQRRRHIAANYYVFYLSLLLKLSFTKIQSGYAVMMSDPLKYLDALFILCQGEERVTLLHRCHIAFQHYLVKNAYHGFYHLLPIIIYS